VSVQSLPTIHRFSLRNYKLSTKITAAFLIVAVIVCIVGGLGIWALGNVDQQAQDMGSGAFSGLQATSALNVDVLRIRGCM